MKRYTQEELNKITAGQLRKLILKLQREHSELFQDASDGRVSRANQKKAQSFSQDGKDS